MREFKYVALSPFSVMRVPDDFQEKTKPHIGRVDGQWSIAWPQTVEPNVLMLRDFIFFMRVITDGPLPPAPPTCVAPCERLQ